MPLSYGGCTYEVHPHDELGELGQGVGLTITYGQGRFSEGEWCTIGLTPAEAQGLAQRLLKEAAEVQFASSLNTAADGGES